MPDITNVDEAGFLKTVTTLTRKEALHLADKNDIGPLTDTHWAVIDFVKNYYETYDRGPSVVKIAKFLGLNSTDICDLFPCGVVKGAYRLAGLPRPPGCV